MQCQVPVFAFGSVPVPIPVSIHVPVSASVRAPVPVRVTAPTPVPVQVVLEVLVPVTVLVRVPFTVTLVNINITTFKVIQLRYKTRLPAFFFNLENGSGTHFSVLRLVTSAILILSHQWWQKVIFSWFSSDSGIEESHGACSVGLAKKIITDMHFPQVDLS